MSGKYLLDTSIIIDLFANDEVVIGQLKRRGVPLFQVLQSGSYIDPSH